jgi:hypothetical protein
MIHVARQPRLGFLGLGWLGFHRMAAIVATKGFALDIPSV